MYTRTENYEVPFAWCEGCLGFEAESVVVPREENKAVISRRCKSEVSCAHAFNAFNEWANKRLKEKSEEDND